MLWAGIGVPVVLAVLAGVHVYWAVGGRWGAVAAVPERAGEPLFRPGPAACLVVATLLVIASALIASKAFGVWLPRGWSTVGTFGVALVFAGRAVGDFRWVGFFKRVRDTR